MTTDTNSMADALAMMRRPVALTPSQASTRQEPFAELGIGGTPVAQAPSAATPTTTTPSRFTSRNLVIVVVLVGVLMMLLMLATAGGPKPTRVGR